MIKNGKDTPLGAAAQYVPDVSNGIMDLMHNVTVGVMQKNNVNGYSKEVPIYIKTMAVRQPFKPRQLEIKPEGQRSWQWFRMHMLVNVRLKVDDRFSMDNVFYRVMSASDYSEFGYYEYDVIQDYQNA